MSLRAAIDAELDRIVEDCDHSGKSHFNASERWTRMNLWLGIPSTAMSAAAGAAFLRSFEIVAATLALLVTVLTALMTFVKPAERAAQHKASGDQYLALKNDARIFKEIKLPYGCADADALSGLDELNQRRRDLNVSSPQFSQADRLLARKGIEGGESKHARDGAIA